MLRKILPLLVFSCVLGAFSTTAMAGPWYDACVDKAIGADCQVDGDAGVCKAEQNNCVGEPRAEGCVMCDTSDSDNNYAPADAGVIDAGSPDVGSPDTGPSGPVSECDGGDLGAFCESGGSYGQCGANYNNCGWEGRACFPCVTNVDEQCTSAGDGCSLGNEFGTCRENLSNCPDDQWPCWVCDIGEDTPTDAAPDEQRAENSDSDDAGCQTAPLTSSPTVPGALLALVAAAGAAGLGRRRE